MPILGLTWPWRAKKGRTVERYDKRGHLRILCVAGGSSVTGEIEVQASQQLRTIDGQAAMIPIPGKTARWTRCPECNHKIKVTGPKTGPRLTIHNAVYQT